MTKTIALDVAKQGIVANSICPGCKLSPASEAILHMDTDNQQLRKRLCLTTLWVALSLLQETLC